MKVKTQFIQIGEMQRKQQLEARNTGGRDRHTDRSKVWHPSFRPRKVGKQEQVNSKMTEKKQ